jgi:hypothetical protein
MSYKLSNSTINLMIDCKRCFWLDKHKVWSRPAGPFPSLPSGMDAILKRHFDGFRDIHKLPPELKKKLKEGQYRLFEDKALLEEWRNWRKGLQWEDRKGNMLTGAVDNILVKGKKLVILDYKTRGFDLKDDTHEHYQSQLDIYCFLLEKNGYTTENHGFLLFYVPKRVEKNGAVIFETTLKKMKIDKSNALRLFNSAIRLLEGSCPKTSECDWCRYVK